VLIAADGGLRHLLALGLTPHLLIGDLDSISAAELADCQARGVEIRRYPTHKNETDLELALQAALERAGGALLLVGALGGRLDHTLANIALLGDPRLEGREARLEDGLVEVLLIRQSARIHGAAGDLVSLIPLGLPAGGIWTEGLAYPLRGETLLPARTRGLSNVMLAASAGVSLESGRLVCIHTRAKPLESDET
jgi:thiamine pyrophosphokinase